jgi:hypothetical protein
MKHINNHPTLEKSMDSTTDEHVIIDRDDLETVNTVSRRLESASFHLVNGDSLESQIRCLRANLQSAFEEIKKLPDDCYTKNVNDALSYIRSAVSNVSGIERTKVATMFGLKVNDPREIEADIKKRDPDKIREEIRAHA